MNNKYNDKKAVPFTNEITSYGWNRNDSKVPHYQKHDLLTVGEDDVLSIYTDSAHTEVMLCNIYLVPTARLFESGEMKLHPSPGQILVCD